MTRSVALQWQAVWRQRADTARSMAVLRKAAEQLPIAPSEGNSKALVNHSMGQEEVLNSPASSEVKFLTILVCPPCTQPMCHQPSLQSKMIVHSFLLQDADAGCVISSLDCSLSKPPSKFHAASATPAQSLSDPASPEAPGSIASAESVDSNDSIHVPSRRLVVRQACTAGSCPSCWLLRLQVRQLQVLVQ